MHGIDYAGRIPTARKAGYMLIISLFLSVILLIMGMALLSVKVLQNQGSSLMEYSGRALAIAEAGIAEAKAKLERDPEFPPPGDADQRIFSYSEDISDIDGTALGSYAVTIDSTWKDYPYFIIKVTSVGTSGPLAAPYARRVITAELDISWNVGRTPDSRTAAPTNAHYFKWTNWQDSGSL
jgi:hypothetical protein